MAHRVLCLRPRADFERLDSLPPPVLSVDYRAAEDADVPILIKSAGALVIPAVGGKLPVELFENTKLRLVQVTGAGVDRLDPSTMTRLGIPAANVAGGSNGAVAEYVVAMAIMLLRRLAWADSEIKGGHYAAFRARMVADNLGGLEGRTVGVVGFGTIGRAVARAFHRMGCRICYHDSSAVDGAAAAAEVGAQAMPLDELLWRADVVTLHVPLIPATQKLIGARELAAMKQGAVLIQASRGGVVDEAALAHALVSGRLGGAAVDVYASEPPTPDHPLLKLQGDAAHRLLVTPHIAGVTRQAQVQLFRASWENCVRVLEHGEEPLSRVY